MCKAGDETASSSFNKAAQPPVTFHNDKTVTVVFSMSLAFRKYILL